MSRNNDERPVRSRRYRSMHLPVVTYQLLRLLAAEDATTMSGVVTRLVRGAAKVQFGSVEIAIEKSEALDAA